MEEDEREREREKTVRQREKGRRGRKNATMFGCVAVFILHLPRDDIVAVGVDLVPQGLYLAGLWRLVARVGEEDLEKEEGL